MAWTSKSLVNGYNIQSIPQNMGIYLVSMVFFFLMIPSSWKTVLFRPKQIWISADPAGIAPKSEGLLWSPDTNPSVCGFPGRNPGNPAGWKPFHQWMGFREKKSAGNIRKPWFLPPKLLGVSCRCSLSSRVHRLRRKSWLIRQKNNLNMHSESYLKVGHCYLQDGNRNLSSMAVTSKIRVLLSATGVPTLSIRSSFFAWENVPFFLF